MHLHTNVQYIQSVTKNLNLTPTNTNNFNIHQVFNYKAVLVKHKIPKQSFFFRISFIAGDFYVYICLISKTSDR